MVSQRRQTIAIPLLVGFSYIAITLVLFRFLLPHITTATLDRDNLLLNWMMSWDIYALTHHPLQLLNANIYYPHSGTLLYSDLLLSQSILALPIAVLTGNTVLAYNIWILLSYIVTAFGAYLLALYYTRHQYASWIAGLIFGFSTYRIISIHHFQNLSIYWMPFAILFLQKYLDTWKRKYFIGFVLLFIGQALGTWYNGAFLGFLSLYILAWHYRDIRTHLKKFLIDALLGTLLVAALIGPFAYAYIQFNHSEHSAYSLHDVIHYSADFGGYLLPSPFSIPSRLVGWVGITKERWLENINFLGLGPLLLLLYYVCVKRIRLQEKNYRMYMVGFISFVVLSFGPALHLFDTMLKIPLPFLAIYEIPVFQFIRVPSRLAIIVLLCLAVTIAYLLGSMRIRRAPLRYVLAVLLPCSLLFEAYDTTLPSHLVTNIECTPLYEHMATNDSIHAVVELPLQPDPFDTVKYVFASRCYHKPLFNGYSGYTPKNYPFAESVIRTFPDAVSIDYLSLLGIDHIVLHTADRANRTEMLQKIQNSSRLHIEQQEDDRLLIGIDAAGSSSFYETDFGTVEENTLGVEMNRTGITQQQIIGGRGFDGVFATNLDGGTLNYNHIPINGKQHLHIALQGQGLREDDIVRTVVTTPDGTVVHTEDIHLQDIFEWKNISIDIPENIAELNLQLQLLPHEFTDRVVLNSLLIYTN